MSALQTLVDRCNELDITEQLRILYGVMGLQANIEIESRKELAQLNAEIESLLAQNQQLEMDVHSLKNDYAELDEMYEKQTTELADLRRRLEMAEAKENEE